MPFFFAETISALISLVDPRSGGVAHQRHSHRSLAPCAGSLAAHPDAWLPSTSHRKEWINGSLPIVIWIVGMYEFFKRINATAIFHVCAHIM